QVRAGPRADGDCTEMSDVAVVTPPNRPRLAEAPPAPRTMADTGLDVSQIEQLFIKLLYTGELSGHVLAERMCLPYSLIEPIAERTRAERLIEVRGSAGSGTAGYRYALTDFGRDRAR